MPQYCGIDFPDSWHHHNHSRSNRHSTDHTMKRYKMLVIDPGSTSTKVAVYIDDKPTVKRSVKHSLEELAGFNGILNQKEFRTQVVLDTLEEAGVKLTELDAIIGRGGLIENISSGLYEVNRKMVEDVTERPLGQHACNLGPIIAYELAQKAGIKAYTVDPATVNDMPEVARITGLPEIRRIPTFHALNTRAVARRYAESIGRDYEEMNVIVVHMGGGISIGAHKRGKVVDVNNCLDGDGPFSPERAGSIPTMQMAKLCYSGKFTLRQMSNHIAGEGGIFAYIGTNDMLEVARRRKEGDHQAIILTEAMAYNIGKWIGANAAVLRGKVDAIILTGGIAYDPFVCNCIKEMVSFIAPVEVIPGEDELEALAMNGLLALRGKLRPKIY